MEDIFTTPPSLKKKNTVKNKSVSIVFVDIQTLSYNALQDFYGHILNSDFAKFYNLDCLLQGEMKHSNF